MRQKPISARINPDVLEYIKRCHQPINTLINSLLEKWMKQRQDIELLLFQEETGTDELNQLKERHTEQNSQCCKNCKHLNYRYCIKTGWFTTQIIGGINKFCCIYWERKKERH